MKTEFKILQKVTVSDFGCFKPEDVNKDGKCFISYINYKTNKVCFSDAPHKSKPSKLTTFTLSDVKMEAFL